MTEYTGRLKEIYEELPEEEREALDAHILGGTSAAWLSNTLTACGYKISSTTLKEQRARFNGEQRKSS